MLELHLNCEVAPIYANITLSTWKRATHLKAELPAHLHFMLLKFEHCSQESPDSWSPQLNALTWTMVSTRLNSKSLRLQTAGASAPPFYHVSLPVLSCPCSPSWKAPLADQSESLKDVWTFKSWLTATCRVVWDPAWVLATFTSSLGNVDALDSFFGVHIHNWTNIYRTWVNMK